MAIFNLVLDKEESGPKVMDYFLSCYRMYMRSHISGGLELLGEYCLWWVGGVKSEPWPNVESGVGKLLSLSVAL